MNSNDLLNSPLAKQNVQGIEDLAVTSAMRILLVLAVASVMIFPGCASESTKPVSRSAFDRRDPATLGWIHEQLKGVSLDDGITREEAQKLVVCYWNRFCSSCGVVGEVKEGRHSWSVTVYTGVLPVAAGHVVVNKDTGHISWPRGPTVTNWSQLWE